MAKKKVLKRMAAGLLAGTMALSLVVSAASASAEKKKKKAEEAVAKEVDLNGTYHAALGVQTATNLWIQRMAYFEETQNDKYNTDMWDKLFYVPTGTKDVEIAEGTFTDAEIAGNGTYTVSLANANFLSETTISQMHIATDIPLNDTIKFSDVVLKINGKTVVEFEEAFMENEEPYLIGGMDILLMNHWRPVLVNDLNEKGVAEDSANGYNYLTGDGDDNIEVTFTVSGFAYDNAGTTGADEETSDGDDSQVSADSSNNTDNEASTGNAAAAETEDEASSNTMVYIIIAIVVVVVIAVVVVVSRKKKE